ncbi:MAG: IS1182 family transposase [Ignavibacteriaceae bacterium]|nr:IS1182 family transposase [Ignavibacteriaceae bacterium]
MKYIESADRQQYQLMSSLDDSVAIDHPVRIIDKIVDSIVLGNPERFEKARETEAGRPKYHDSIMVKLYLYGYFNGISSSRKLEVETHRNKEVIWLIGSLTPDHWTISNYRKDNGENIKFVTKKFREFLKDSGYIKLKTVAIDGSKVKAYTSRDMLSVEKIETKLKGIDKKIEEYLLKIAESDRRDEVIDEIEGDGIEPNNTKYLDKIIELQSQVEQLQKQKEILEKEGRKYISASDADARLMKSRDGKIPAYNVQIAVDTAHKMIADSEVVTEETDSRMLPVMVESIKEELGEAPEEVIADKGYSSLDLIEAVEKKESTNGGGINIYASQEKSIRDKEEIKFEYDAEKDEYTCSAGKRLVLFTKNKQRGNSLANIYRGIECEGCPLRSKCTKSKKGRMFQRYINQQWRDEYKKKMLSELGKTKTAIRKTIVEHPFGTIKYLMGKIPLLLRGLKKVTTEVNLYVTVYNLKRLVNIDPFEHLMMKIENYKWETA